MRILLPALKSRSEAYRALRDFSKAGIDGAPAEMSTDDDVSTPGYGAIKTILWTSIARDSATSSLGL